MKSSLEQICHRLFKKAMDGEGEVGGKEIGMLQGEEVEKEV